MPGSDSTDCPDWGQRTVTYVLPSGTPFLHQDERQYDAKDGTKRTAWDIVADEVEFLTPQGHHSGTDGFGAPTGEAQSGYTEAVSKGSGGADYAQKPHNDYGGFTEVDDDELPF